MRSLPLLVLVVVLGFGRLSAAQALGVGEVVLLITRPAAEAVGPLRTALAAEDPRVRGAAARVATALSARELSEPLSAALVKETDAGAGSEQLRALLLLNGSGAVASVEPDAIRLGGPAVVTYLEWLAAHDPARLAAVLSLVPEGTGTRNSAMDRAMIRAASPGSLLRFEILQAWMAVAPVDSWGTVLRAVIRTEADLRAAETLLGQALASTRDHVREETMWFLLAALATGQSPPRALSSTLTRPEAVASWEAFGRELLHRHANKEDRIDRSTFLASQSSIHRLRLLGRLNLLTSGETAEARRRDIDLLASTMGPARFDGQVTARSVQIWTDRLIDELVRASGCPMTNTVVAAVAAVTFRADGRPERIQSDISRLPERCIPVFQALVRTTVTEVHRPLKEGQQQWVLLPLSRDFADCVASAAGSPARVGGEVGDSVITTPRKIKDVRPQYPESMLRARRQGTVVMEATISETGCVCDLHVVKSAGETPLDLAGMMAVSQWVFTPTLVGQTPVAVDMTVTVTFTAR